MIQLKLYYSDEFDYLAGISVQQLLPMRSLLQAILKKVNPSLQTHIIMKVRICASNFFLISERNSADKHHIFTVASRFSDSISKVYSVSMIRTRVVGDRWFDKKTILQNSSNITSP